MKKLEKPLFSIKEKGKKTRFESDRRAQKRKMAAQNKVL
jgi:hypothetical protein